MHRRRVLQGLVAGVPLFAGCSALSGGGGNGSGDNATGGNETTAMVTDVTETVQETATQAATATPTETATPTATATATPTPTATPTATSTPAPTATATPIVTQTTTGGEQTERGTTAGTGTTIDLSQLTTYTSQAYPYSVKRPAGWTVDASDPTQVIFESNTGFGQQQVLVIEGMSGISLDTLVSLLNDAFSQGFDGYQVLNQRNVTLSNGNPAAVLSLEVTDSAFEGIVLRGKSVYTIADGVAYGVLVLVVDNAYSSTVEESMTEIVESLTVEGRSTSSPL